LTLQVQSLGRAVHRQQATTFHIQPPASSAAANKMKSSSSLAVAAARDRERDKSSLNLASLQQQQPLFQSPFN